MTHEKQMYIVNSDKLKNKLRKIITKRYGTLKQFALGNNLKKKTVWSWFEKKCKRIPFSFVEKCIESNIWKFLDGERATTIGRLSIKINKDIATKEAIILGWILSEGTISKYKVTISQSNKEVLKSMSCKVNVR